MSSTRRHSSAPARSSITSGDMPVAYTSASIPPSLAAASSTALAQSLAVTSQQTGIAPLPASATADSSSSRRRAANATRAPARLASRPTSRPTPLDAPITRTRRPERSYWTPIPSLYRLGARFGPDRIRCDAHLPTRARDRIPAPREERSVGSARGGRGPFARTPVARLRVGDLPLVFRGPADPVALPGSALGAARRGPARAAQPRPDDPARPLRGSPRHRVRRRDPQLRRAAAAGRRWHVDHARHARRLLRAAPARVRPLGGGLCGRRARGRAVRGLDRRGLLRRVDVRARA